jgi:predicted membrane metal-binding protein
MKNSILYCFVVCFALGIILRFYIDLGVIFPSFLILLSSVFILLIRGRNNRFLIIFGVLAFSFGMLRFDIAENLAPSRELHNVVEEDILIEGVITDEPDERENNVKLIVSFEKIFLDGADNSANFDVQTKGIITTALYPKWSYGDRVVLEGVLREPENFSSDTGREFNYVGYLAKDGIYYQMFKPKITLVRHGEGNFIKTKLFEWKRAFLENISRVIHEPYAALLGGLTVGAKQSLGKDLLDDFRATGLWLVPARQLFARRLWLFL